MDPVSAIAGAAQEGFKYMTSVINTFFGGYKKQRKIIEAQGQAALAVQAQMTEQERIKYNEAIQNNNTAMALSLLNQAQSRINSQQTATYLLIGGVMAAILLIIIVKSKKK